MFLLLVSAAHDIAVMEEITEFQSFLLQSLISWSFITNGYKHVTNIVAVPIASATFAHIDAPRNGVRQRIFVTEECRSLL